MSRPYPGTTSLEQGDQDGRRAVRLHKLDHYGICAWIQEEFVHSLYVSMQRCQNRLQKMWVGGKHVKQMLEGVDKVWLEGRTLTR